MRLVVKRAEEVINELRFTRGPVYIGRQIGSQVFLPDRAVSRQHSVLYTTTDGKWVVEDLDSANKTYLNNEAIHKAEIKNGDIIKISDFYIEVYLDEPAKQSSVSLEDTLHSTLHEPQIVIRSLDSIDAPLIKMQAKRCKDFSNAASSICKSADLNGLVSTLLDLLFKQFGCFHGYAAVRKNPDGAMEASKGRKITGQTFKLEELKLSVKINDAVKSRHYVLVQRIPRQEDETEKIGSAMIVPIICEGNCFGILYADNSPDHERYSTSDLDYLILISLMAGAFIRNL